MYLTRIAGIEPMHTLIFANPVLMYLTRIAGIEPAAFLLMWYQCNTMYLTRIAGIEPQ